jgi:hypothetical protein
MSGAKRVVCAGAWRVFNNPVPFNPEPTLPANFILARQVVIPMLIVLVMFSQAIMPKQVAA